MIRPTSGPASRSTARLTALFAAVAAVAVAPAIAPAPAHAVPTPQVRYSDHEVLAESPLRAVVSRRSKPDGARLVLERRFPDGWQVADASAEATSRGYVLEVPTDQFGRFSYRVTARDHGRVVAASSKDTITVRPPYDPLGRARQHVFSADPRARWDSCRTVSWVFNRSDAPAHGLSQVEEAVWRIHLATGVDFAYAGTTDQKPNPYGRNVRGADVIVGWRTTEDYRPFTRRPRTVGIGGNTYDTGYQEADGAEVSRAIAGGVVLNASRGAQISNGFGKGATWGEVVVHELGHVMGLAHVGARSQIMYPSPTARDADWGAGDLAGLRALGDTRGCLHRSAARPSREVVRVAFPDGSGMRDAAP